MVTTHAQNVWQVIGVAVMWVALYATSMDLAELDQLLGQAVLDALEYARIPIKAAAAIMRIDESHLRKSLRGEPAHHLSLTRLARLPFGFWLYFSPSLIALMVRAHIEDVVEDAQLRRRA